MASTTRGYPSIIQLERRIDDLTVGRRLAAPLHEAFTIDMEYTPPARLLWCDVINVAGGAAGGGVPDTTAADEMAVGSGGGAGETVRRVFTAEEIGSGPIPVTIGSAGSGVTGADGGAGMPTRFGTLLASDGGSPGLFNGITTGSAVVAGGDGGLSANQVITTQYFPGGNGENGTAEAGGVITGGRGGFCLYGVAGVGSATAAVGQAAQAGGAASGYGAGGGGAHARGANPGAMSGGDGAPGVLFVISYTLA